MPLKSPIHSSAPALLSPYLKPLQAGAWKWSAHDSTRILCGSCLLPLEEHKAFQNPMNHSTILNTMPIHLKCWRDTYVLCLTWGILDQRVPGAQKKIPSLWVLAVGSAQNTINPNPVPAPAALEMHLDPESTLAPSCGHMLEQQLSGFPLLSCSAPPGCIGPGPYGGWISFLQFFQIPSNALPNGLFSLSKAFRAMRPTYPMPLRSNTQLLMHHTVTAILQCYTSLHLIVYEDRCVYM